MWEEERDIRVGINIVPNQKIKRKISFDSTAIQNLGISGAINAITLCLSSVYYTVATL